jgi:hypothetical protein
MRGGPGRAKQAASDCSIMAALLRGKPAPSDESLGRKQFPQDGEMAEWSKAHPC